MKKNQLFSALLTGMLITICSIFANAQAVSSSALKAYTLADGRFSIEMPSQPELEKEDADGVLSMSYISEIEGLMVNVSEFSYSDGRSMTEDPEMNESMLAAFFTGVLNGIKETQPDDEALEIGEIEEIEFAGMSGKEQMIKMSGIPTYTRGLVGDGRLYFIGVMSSDDAQIKRILASFKVNKPKAKASAVK
jgi:hypothetical protein